MYASSSGTAGSPALVRIARVVTRASQRVTTATGAYGSTRARSRSQREGGSPVCSSTRANAFARVRSRGQERHHERIERGAGDARATTLLRPRAAPARGNGGPAGVARLPRGPTGARGG